MSNQGRLGHIQMPYKQLKRNMKLYTHIYTKILEVILFAFAYRLFHEDFSSVNGALQNTHLCSGK